MKRMKTKKSTVVNEKKLIAAVDIGKTIHWRYFRTPNNIEVKPFSFHNDMYSFNAFLQRMQKFQQEQGLDSEFFTIMKKAVSKSVLFLLKNYPLPEDIVELGIETLTNRLKKISRGKLGKQRAQELIEAACQSNRYR